jgi:hypothetical protein
MNECGVACQLSSEAFQQRRDVVLTLMRQHLKEQRSHPNGLALRFAAEVGQLECLAEFMEIERQCCPFLRFQLAIEPFGKSIWLELTGQEGTRDWLEDDLGLSEFANS